MKLQLVSGGKCFAGLAVDLNIHLSEVREKIEADLQDLMPSSFKFLYRNIPLGANQESRLTLLHCVEKSDVPGADVYVLHFKESSESNVETTKSKTLHSWLKKSKPSHGESSKSNLHNSGESTCLGEKRASPAQCSSNFKVDVFSDDEILNQSCWLERERRKYWNFKVNQLQASKDVNMYNKTELLGVLDTAWTLKKAELLRIRASELQIMQERFKTVYPDRYQSVRKRSKDDLAPSENVFKNTELVNKTLFFIQNENAKMTNVNCKWQKTQAEQRLHQYFYELKRASDALFKALSRHEVRLNKFEEDNFKKSEQDSGDDEVLTFDEEGDIAAKIHLERKDYQSS